MIINQAAATYMSMKGPVGKNVKWNDREFQVIGVVEDLVMSSPYRAVAPTVFLFSNRNHAVIEIRLAPQVAVAEAIQKISSVFQKHNPGAPFQYKFVDDEYDRKFASEVRVGKLALVFATLAILISCLGLVGLASFVASRRTKEIGIRKVVGASLLDIWVMLSGNFVILVSVACLVALPLSYHFLSQWLMKYEYRVDFAWWLFPSVIAGAVLVTLLTVSYQAIRAGRQSPVVSLRVE